MIELQSPHLIASDLNCSYHGLYGYPILHNEVNSKEYKA